MLDIFLTTLPIYLMIAIGFLAVRTRYLPAAHIAALSQFTLKIALIALIVTAIAFPRGDSGLDASFFAAYMAGSVATLLIGFAALRLLMRKAAPESWILAMGMSNSNSGFLGFPIASLFFGEHAATVFAMTMIIENAVTLPVPTIAAGVAGHRGAFLSQIRPVLTRIVTNPLVIAVVVALAIRVSGLDLGDPVERGVRLLAGAASPVALFVIGGTVATMSLNGHWRRSLAVAAGKLVLHPLMVALALMLVPGVPPALSPVGILFAAMPMLTVFPIFAGLYGFGAVASGATMVTTVLGLLSVSFVLHQLTGL